MTDGALKEQSIPCGAPMQANDTLPVNPPMGVTASAYDAGLLTEDCRGRRRRQRETAGAATEDHGGLTGQLAYAGGGDPVSACRGQLLHIGAQCGVSCICLALLEGQQSGVQQTEEVLLSWLSVMLAVSVELISACTKPPNRC